MPHFSFLLLLAYYCNEGYKEGGMPGLYWSGGTVVTLFCCVVLHELGHSFTGMSFGIKRAPDHPEPHRRRR
jgi:Zn-dependent protease